ncbi:MAG: hypothetical protein PHV68_02995 [Candidatus Gastranaerophilales bacterium]|nr:hypothetical protein [Candidatus Gastranaerophilales bacterium]
MGNISVIGFQLNHRTDSAVKLQEVLTKYGCSIKSRIGLHEVENGICSPSGIILLEIIDENSEKLVEELNTIDCANVQIMKF